MRGPDEQTQHIFSYLSPGQRVPADHPLRAIRALTDDALRSMSPQSERLYSAMGRPSIPPEQLLRALLLQVLYTVRSERLFMEELDYNLLFRWFVGLNMDDPVWHPTTLYEEPGPAAGRRGCGNLLRCDPPSGPAGRSAVRRILHRGRHATGSLGEPEELPPGHGAAGAATSCGMRLPSSASSAATR